MSIQDRITKADAIRFAKVLIFARSGMGKTHMLGTAELDKRTSKILVLDFENGTTSLAGSGVDVLHVKTWQDYEQVYAYLANEKPPYKSVALDNISEVHIFSLHNMAREENIGGPKTQITQQAYGKALIQKRILLREFRDLPMNVFFTSWSKNEDVAGEGNIQIPSLFGQLALESTGMFDACIGIKDIEKVGKLLEEAKEKNLPKTQRWLVLKNDPQLAAKIRTPYHTKMPSIVGPITTTSPSITMLFDAWGIPQPE